MRIVNILNVSGINVIHMKFTTSLWMFQGGLDKLLPIPLPQNKNANYGSDRSVPNFSTEFQPTASHFLPSSAIYLSHVSHPGQHSSHFKEMWNYFGKIKLARDKIKRALKILRL